MNKFNSTLLFFLILISPVFAQDNWEKEGKTATISDEAVYIEKNREIVLPRANRSFNKIELTEEPQDSIRLEYSFDNIYLPQSPFSSRIRISRIKPDPLEKLYSSYIKGGFGTYNGTLLQGSFANKRNRNTSLGVNFSHMGFGRGPNDIEVDRDEVGTFNQFINPYLEWKNKDIALKSELYYQRSANDLYGVDSSVVNSTDTFTIANRNYNIFGAIVQLDDRNQDDSFTYSADLDAYLFNTSFESKESAINYSSQNHLELSNQVGLNLALSGFFVKYSVLNNLRSINRSLIRFQPTLTFSRWGIDLEAGFNFVYENDTLPKMNRSHFYPVLTGRYNIADNISLSAGLKGDVMAQQLSNIANENPFLNDVSSVQNTLNPLEFFAHIDYSPNSKLGLQTGFSVNRFRNNLVFAADTLEGVFSPVYMKEGNTQTNFYAAVFSQINEQFNASLKADYFLFQLESFESLPYRPNFSMQADLNYTIAGRFKIGLQANLQGEMDEAFKNPESDDNFLLSPEAAIPAIFDIDLSFNYKVSDRASAFIQADNILNKEYIFFSNYPVRGVRMMAGFQYAF